MTLDINTKKVIKNAYRITKVRGKTALRLRVPGGHLEAELLPIIYDIANKYGNGTVHLTIRQGFEIPGIDFQDIDKINKFIAPYLEKTLIKCGVELIDINSGYPAAGTRNVSACIGNAVCPYANVNTYELSKKVEKTIYPNDYHVKIAIAGCPNDCVKAHMQDFGIIAINKTEYNEYRCISCERCVNTCRTKVTEALSMKDYKVIKDDTKCIGCGECAGVCPISAWTRNPTQYFRVVILGRTGKKNPRLAVPFANWITEDVLFKMLRNLYIYIDKFIDRSLPKEHVGYIVDRTGFKIFKEWILKDINLNPEAKIVDNIKYRGYRYTDKIF